jgi:threonine dehydrogenase-like Zn-dependent dehydrogenase
MKAIVKYGYGARETEIRDVPIPTIDENDVLIEVKAAGVCGSDIAFDDGHHANLLNPPVILGHEFSGVISKVGAKVTDWKVGDRVVSDNTGYVCGKCYACSVADYLACPDRLGIGYGMDGGFTKYVKIPGQVLAVFPNTLIKLPQNMSFEEAAILDPCCNAYMAVVQESKFMPGDYAAVFGVGALGQFSIQALRAAGAAKIVAIGLSGDEQRMELAKKNGATDIIYSDKEDVQTKIDEITKGDKFALVVDCAGVNVVLKLAMEITRTSCGEIVKIGYDEKPVNYSMDPLLDNAISVKGHFGYNWVSWRNVMNLVEAGKMDLKCMISHKMNLSEFRQAFDLVRSKESIKIILYPED